MKHLDNVGLGYFAHARGALSISWQLMVASMAVFVHAIYPDVFETYATDTMKRIIEEHEQYVERESFSL